MRRHFSPFHWFLAVTISEVRQGMRLVSGGPQSTAKTQTGVNADTTYSGATSFAVRRGRAVSSLDSDARCRVSFFHCHASGACAFICALHARPWRAYRKRSLSRAFAWSRAPVLDSTLDRGPDDARCDERESRLRFISFVRMTWSEACCFAGQAGVLFELLVWIKRRLQSLPSFGIRSMNHVGCAGAIIRWQAAQRPIAHGSQTLPLASV